MIACKNAEKYEAKKPPRCNDGKGCSRCRTKWAMKKIDEVCSYLDRAPKRIFDGNLTRRHLNIVRNDLKQVLPPKVRVLSVRQGKLGTIDATLEWDGIRLNPLGLAWKK